MVERKYTFRLQAKGGDQVRGEFRKVAGSVREAGVLVEKEMARVNRSVSVFGRAGNATGLRNIGLQLSQIAQQGATTGNYLRALAIQIPDLTLGFGTLGILLGAAAAALIPFAGNLLDGKSNAEQLSEALGALEERMSALRQASAVANAPIEQLQKKYGDFASIIQRAARELIRLESVQARLELLDVARTFAPGIVAGTQDASIQGTLQAYLRQIEEIDARIERLQEKGARAAASIAQQERNRAEIVAKISALMDDEPRKLGLTTEQALALGRALATVADAQADAAAKAAALQQALAALETRQTNLSGLTKEQLEARQQLVDALRRAAAIMGEMETLSGNVAGNVASAAGSAATLARNLGLVGEIGRRAAVKGVREGAIPPEALQDLRSPVIEQFLDRRRQNRTPPPSSSGGGGGGVSERERALKAYQQLRASIDETFAAELRLREAEETLNAAMRAGIITGEEKGALLDRLREQMQHAGDASKELGQSFAETFSAIIRGASSAGEALARLADRLADRALQKAFSGLWTSFSATDTGSDIGKILSFFFHEGGLVGAGGGTARQVPAYVFAGAPRMHSGGVAGLRPDEVPAILQRGEVVLPRGAQVGGGRTEVVIRLADGLVADILNQADQNAAKVTVVAIEDFSRRGLPTSLRRAQSRPGVVG